MSYNIALDSVAKENNSSSIISNAIRSVQEDITI
jgi:hypothetical protein